MKYTVQIVCFLLFILMACGDEGGPASGGNAKSMSVFSRLHDDFERFARIQESAQFSTLSPGLTFESQFACGAAFVDVETDLSNLSHFDLVSGTCSEFDFDGEQYFVMLNNARFNDDLLLNLQMVFYGGKPRSGVYDLNCMMSDCDPVGLVLLITNSEFEELSHYHGMPDVVTVQVSSGSVTASFDGLFYSDFEEDQPFNVSGTLVCCQ